MKHIILLAGFVLTGICSMAQTGKLVAEKSGKNGVLIHKVQAGEGLYSLSNYYDVKVSEIAAANGFPADQGLQIGQQVKVPLNASNLSVKKNASPVRYTVSSGESLSSISALFGGLTVKELKSLNNIKGNSVNKGAELIVGYFTGSGPGGATAVISGTDINVRKGPSTDDAVVGVAQLNDKVAVVKKVNSEWSQIRMADGTQGYIASRFLGTSPVAAPAATPVKRMVTAVINGTDINIRKGPSTADEIVGTGQADEPVEVLKKVDDEWSQIRLKDGTTGYIASRFISQPGQKAGLVKTKPEGKPAEITGTNINIRKGPSTDEEVVGLGQPADKVLVLRKVNEEWSQIRMADGKEGYMVSRFLGEPGTAVAAKPAPAVEKPEPVQTPKLQAPTQTSKAVITGTNINIRKGPSTDEEVVGVAQLNDAIIVLRKADQEWSEIVGADGTRGFIASRFMAPEGSQAANAAAAKEITETEPATAAVAEKVVVDPEPVTKPEPTGYFTKAYNDRTDPGLTSTKTVNSGIFKTDRGWADGRYYVLIDNVAPGTIVKLANPSNQQIVYAKVLGQIKGVKYSENLDARISEAAADKLGLQASADFKLNVIY